jgi:cellulose synthase/poly-beta-1,6-N-acetylglucosamine synthase-like glycosyltransferase
MSDTIFSRNELISSGLLKAGFTPDVFDGFEPKEWIPRLIEKDLLLKGRDDDFFHSIAKLYNLQYFRQLHVPLNPKDAIAYRVPTETLIKSQLYPFKKDGKLYIASCTPFIRKEYLDDVLSFTGRAGYEIVMASPHQLREALKALYYFEFSIVAQNNLQYSKKYLSASPPVVARFAKIAVILGLVLLLGVLILPQSFLLALFFAVNLLYIYLNGLRFTTFIVSMIRPGKSVVNISKHEVAELDDGHLPRYTVLVPLRFEKAMVKRLIKRLAALDYPKAKLEVFFLVGVDDKETIKALQDCGIDSGNLADSISDEGYYMSIIKVPKVQVDTKPLVCDYGLRFATGDFTVVYDAEDKPESDQLKKAVVGFDKAKLDTMCLQGKLNFYNTRTNLLTRFFSLEYGMWFDYFLPGLQQIGSPVPLGGTSNHFITSALRRTGEWDPYNVTEDADLGMRIYRNGHRTRILNTYTYEEAVSTLGAWLKQRSRWEKGFLATLIVHLRHPIRLYRELGAKRFIYGVTVFFGNFYMPFINPLLWVLTLLWVFNIFSLGNMPIYIWLPAVINLVVGNVVHIAMHFMAAIRSKQYSLAPLAFVIPVYWILISVATYIASWDLLFRPYQWKKTPHGVRRQ